MDDITIGITQSGLRYAQKGDIRVVVYEGGGHQITVRVERIGWILANEDEYDKTLLDRLIQAARAI